MSTASSGGFRTECTADSGRASVPKADAGTGFDLRTVNQTWSPVPCEKNLYMISSEVSVKELSRQAVFTGCGCSYCSQYLVFFCRVSGILQHFVMKVNQSIFIHHI